MAKNTFNYKLKAGVSGTSIGYDGKLVEEDINYSIDGINWMTADIYVNGNKTVPIPGLPDNWNFTITIRSLTPEIVNMMSIGIHEFDLRHNEPTINRNTYGKTFDNLRHVLKGECLSMLPQIQAELAANGTADLQFVGYAIRCYRDDEEMLVMDQIDDAFRINGVDQKQLIRKGLQTQ